MATGIDELPDEVRISYTESARPVMGGQGCCGCCDDSCCCDGEECLELRSRTPAGQSVSPA
jgi:hypothetical protein